ncbi:pentatricopeptide repeat-containing protein [Canna indica]|uniref:Pentatricopeptide repeat-containing protein n=1 Tax=Canna indica TaxID=4628 RepID=A0AAQ3JKW8_9LILI|nr:pentatricopeptide repeat-containing protein [Canna indica]
MQLEGVNPNQFKFSIALTLAAAEGTLEKGKQIDSQLVKLEYQDTVFVCNPLINMYSKCGLVREARAVFDRMTNPDVVSWNAMVAGLVVNGHDNEAIQVFRMRAAGQIEFACQLHCHVVKDRFELHPNVITSLMVVYGKCNKMHDAFQLFSTMESPNRGFMDCYDQRVYSERARPSS